MGNWVSPTHENRLMYTSLNVMQIHSVFILCFSGKEMQVILDHTGHDY